MSRQFDNYEQQESSFPYYGDFESPIEKQGNERIIFADNDFLTNYANPDYHPLNQNIYDQSNVYQEEAPRVAELKDNQKKPVITNAELNQEIKNRRITSAHYSKINTIGKNIADTSFYRQRLENLRNDNSESNSQPNTQKRYSINSNCFLSGGKKLPRPLKQRKNQQPSFTKEELMSPLVKDQEHLILFDVKEMPAIERKKHKVEHSDSDAKTTHSTVLKKGLAGVFDEESAGIEKIQKQFFKTTE